MIRFDCAYVSPQTFALDIVLHRVVYIYLDMRFRIFKLLGRIALGIKNYLSDRAGGYLQNVFRNCAGLGPREYPTWRGREQFARADDAAIDVDLLSMAYDVSMGHNILSAAAICLTEMPSPYVIQGFRMLEEVHLSHYSFRWPNGMVSRARGPQDATLWIDALLSMAHVGSRRAGQHWERTLREIDHYLPWNLTGAQDGDLIFDLRYAEWMVSAVASLTYHAPNVHIRRDPQMIVMGRLLGHIASLSGAVVDGKTICSGELAFSVFQTLLFSRLWLGWEP